MNRLSAEERYLHDPLFHHLVDAMVDAIETLTLTPSEIREAAVYAALRVEMRRPPSLHHVYSDYEALHPTQKAIEMINDYLGGKP